MTKHYSKYNKEYYIKHKEEILSRSMAKYYKEKHNIPFYDAQVLNSVLCDIKAQRKFLSTKKKDRYRKIDTPVTVYFD